MASHIFRTKVFNEINAYRRREATRTNSKTKSSKFSTKSKHCRRRKATKTNRNEIKSTVIAVKQRKRIGTISKVLLSLQSNKNQRTTVCCNVATKSKYYCASQRKQSTSTIALCVIKQQRTWYRVPGTVLPQSCHELSAKVSAILQRKSVNHVEPRKQDVLACSARTVKIMQFFY